MVLGVKGPLGLSSVASELGNPVGPPIVNPQARPPMGVYVGASPTGLLQFEAWLGHEVDYIAAHTGRANWWDWDNSINWTVGLWATTDRDVRWTIPMFANGSTLAQAAAGAYDSHYLLAAQRLASTAARDPDGKIIVRIGEEFNGDWMPWAAEGHEAEYIAAFRHIVDVFRSVSDQFVFEWNVSQMYDGMDPATAYPGDDYVDIIGMDFYYDSRWFSPDPVVAWDEMVSSRWGLQWHQDFAALHNKPTAYSEWGVDAPNADAFVRAAAQWFDDHNVLYQIYWNSDDAFAGTVSNNRYPGTGNAFINAFGATDTPPLLSALSTTLAQGVVSLTLTGSAAVNATGNLLDNILTGNAGANRLDGG